MATRKPPWTTRDPKAHPTPLAAHQKHAAKQRAAKAGRRYPNLVDNMWASKQPRA